VLLYPKKSNQNPLSENNSFNIHYMLEFPTISDNQNDVVEPAAFTIIS
jgi:hypothetical protein